MGRDKHTDGTWAEDYFDGWNSIPGSGPPPEILSSTRGPLTADNQTFYDAGYAHGRKAATENPYSKK